MSISFQAAQDAVYGLIKGAIDANANAILGYSPDVRYVGVPKSFSPPSDKLWIRVSAQIVIDGQVSLANAQGKTLYEATGLLAVELYCPRNVAGSVDANGIPLADAIRASLRSGSSSGEVWFTDAMIVQLAETITDYPIRVSAKFTYKTEV